jgi:hypothetical protein
MQKWNTKVKRHMKKIKVDEHDDFDTDFIEMDKLLDLYIQEFRENKRQT